MLLKLGCRENLLVDGEEGCEQNDNTETGEKIRQFANAGVPLCAECLRCGHRATFDAAALTARSLVGDQGRWPMRRGGCAARCADRGQAAASSRRATPTRNGSSRAVKVKREVIHNHGSARILYKSLCGRRPKLLKMTGKIPLAERMGFEPTRRLNTVYSLSRGAPSTTRPPLRLRKWPVSISASTRIAGPDVPLG